MKIDCELAGTPLAPYATTISWRQTANFAAALGETLPLYLDDEIQGGPAAPPTFPVAVTWPILSRLEGHIDAPTFPKEVLATQVHYTEHLILHRLVRPGDRLEIQGQVAGITPHRAGTHAVIRLDARDSQGGPVFTEFIGAMLRGVTCQGAGKTLSIPEPPLPGPAAEPAWTSIVSIDPLAPFLYDAGADIHFPIHTSPAFARAVGLPGIILQGTATLGLAVRELLSQTPGAAPQNVREIYCRFTGMVKPGTEIEVCCLDIRQDQGATLLFFEVLNQENKKAIRNGCIKLERQTP